MLLLLVFWHCCVWGLKNLQVRYYRSWKLFDIRCNVVEIWVGFTFSVFSKTFKYITRFNIYFFIGGTLSLVNMQRTTRINLANSCVNHIFFCFIKCYLSKLSASYISPVSLLFVLFLLYVSFLDIYLLLCHVVATYIHHHLRTRDQYLRQKDKRKAERCFRVASWTSGNVKRDQSSFCEFTIFLLNLTVH